VTTPAKRSRGSNRAVVNLYEAKTHLSDLVDRASRGEEITIAKAGTPMARLVPIRSAPRIPGVLKGKVRISADFDAPLPAEILSGFRGGPEREEP
jgi:prevent-host-death family protein